MFSGPTGTSLTAGSANFLCLNAVTLTGNVTVSFAKWRYYVGGVLSNFAMSFSTNTDTATNTFTTQKNAAVAGNQSLSVPPTTTGFFQDTVNTDTVTANDDWYILTSTITAAKNVTQGMGQCTFNATTNTVAKFAFQQGNAGYWNGVTAASTAFGTINGIQTNNLTESFMQTKFKTAATFNNLYYFIRTNTRATATSLGVRKNGVNGNLGVSVTSATTGIFQDTSDSDSIAIDDLVNLYATAGAT